MSSLTPIVRDTRQRDIVAAVGQTVFSFPCFLVDTLDLAVQTLVAGATDFMTTTGYTIAIVSPIGATVTFDTAPYPAGGSPVTVRLIGRRIGNRITDVTRAGALSSAMLERELDTIEITLQELRRDMDALTALLVSYENRVTLRQVQLWLATAMFNGGSAIYAVDYAISADIADPVTIQWRRGATMLPGDGLYAFIQTTLGLTSVQMGAAFSAMKALTP